MAFTEDYLASPGSSSGYPLKHKHWSWITCLPCFEFQCMPCNFYRGMLLACVPDVTYYHFVHSPSQRYDSDAFTFSRSRRENYVISMEISKKCTLLLKSVDIFPCALFSFFLGREGRGRSVRPRLRLERKKEKEKEGRDPFYNETTVANTSVERRLV